MFVSTLLEKDNTVQKRAQFDDRIRNLIALAQDGSKHSRTLLFSHISDLFLQGRPMASPTHARMLSEILKELLTQVEISTRQELASTLYTLSNPPETLINIMCEDIVEVSGPLLEKAVLPDEKLIHIIRYGTEAHKIHVSRRFGLSPLVRNELEKAWRELHNSKTKYSLNELDKQAEDHIVDIDEETTENILELLRAQNIHRHSSKPDDDKIIKAEEKHPKENIYSPAEIKPTQNLEQEITEHDISLNMAYSEKMNPFPSPPKIANDSERYERNTYFDSHITMQDSALDITDDINKQVQNARHDINRQKEFVRTVADWFWEIDRAANITFISEEAFTVFGQASSTLIGEDFISICTPPDTMENDHADQNKETFEALFEHRKSFRNKAFYISTQNEEKTLWFLSGIAIFDIHSGRFTGFRGSARAEITEQDISHITLSEKHSNTYDKPLTRRQEETLEEYIKSRALRAVSQSQQKDNPHRPIRPETIDHTKEYSDEYANELLHNLSHEFRTPLNAIIGFSEMIEMETWGAVNTQYHQNIKNILTAAQHLKEAVNDVLDSAKIEAGLMQINPESFSLKSVIKNCMKNVENMADSSNIKIAENNKNIDVILYNDRQSVELCLTKILTSTIKRGQDGDIITPSVLINSNAQVRIEIPILGPKIDEKNQDNLFQRLKREPEIKKISPSDAINYESKISPNFGLSIAQNLAHMIGGDISTHAERGFLTHFVLTLSNYDKTQ
ncbi:MAG: hypothetical protein K9G26_00020 [Emcibacter sp.]|nr:hypothetical protein [Emcibacter sp.]